jgi:hypothetical protein
MPTILSPNIPAACTLVRLRGIEPRIPAWKAGVLPLNYSRGRGRMIPAKPPWVNFSWAQLFFSSSFQPWILAWAPKCSARALSPFSIQMRERVVLMKRSSGRSAWPRSPAASAASNFPRLKLTSARACQASNESGAAAPARSSLATAYSSSPVAWSKVASSIRAWSSSGDMGFLAADRRQEATVVLPP